MNTIFLIELISVYALIFGMGIYAYIQRVREDSKGKCSFRHKYKYIPRPERSPSHITPFYSSKGPIHLYICQRCNYELYQRGF